MIEKKFLWGDEKSNFHEPTSYQIIYRTWRKFYTNAGFLKNCLDFTLLKVRSTVKAF